MERTLQAIYNFVIDGNRKAVSEQVANALVDQIPADQVLNEALIGAMTEVGIRFQNGEYYVPEMLASARAMQGGLDILKPHLTTESIRAKGRIVIGTVKGDLHDIGKNLVSMMLEGAGFDVIDLGVDVSPERFVAAAKESKAQLIGLSALLTTTMPNMKSTIETFVEHGMRESVRIIVGGAPVTEAYARDIGADGYASDATRAVNLSKLLMEKEVLT